MVNQWKKGQRAEQLAAEYLKARGYRIWKSNWRSGKKELDLVTIHLGELVVVEVKSMMGNKVNLPSEVIDPRKQQNIVRATDAFIRFHNWRGSTRFDVIAICYSSSGVELNHVVNAFIPAVE